MNKNCIGVGLIGVGRHGARYARHLVHDLPMASLRAVCRRHPERGFQFPGAESVKVYGEAAGLIADSSVDVVVVVTPPRYALDLCRLAAHARKPLLIEKPLAISVADARAMVALCREHDVPLMTAQTLRFDNTIQQMQLLRSFIGRSEQLHLITRIEKRNTSPDHAEGYGMRGAVLEIGIHLLDLVRFLTGDEVHEVRCTMDGLPASSPEMTASVHLVTLGGTTCHLEIARVLSGRVGRADWSGSRGRLEVDWGACRVRGVTGTDITEFELPPSQTVLATLRAFLHAVRDHSPMPITGEDGCRAVELAEACYQSAQLGGASIILPAAG